MNVIDGEGAARNGRPDNADVVVLRIDRLQLGVALGSAEYSDTAGVRTIADGIPREPQLGTLVVVGDRLKESAELLEFIRKGRDLEGSTVTSAEEQALDGAEFHPHIVGGLLDVVARNLVIVVAAR